MNILKIEDKNTGAWKSYQNNPVYNALSELVGLYVEVAEMT